jgi:hypothetical protein
MMARVPALRLDDRKKSGVVIEGRAGVLPEAPPFGASYGHCMSTKGEER